MDEYIPTEWVDHSTEGNAEIFNHIEQGIKAVTDAVLNGVEDDIVASLDGTVTAYNAAMRKYILSKLSDADNPDPTELTGIVSDWYALMRNNCDWCGYTSFYNTDVSDATYGVKGGDNADMNCEVSTTEYQGADDYAGNPLFACTDVNFYEDADTLDIVITAVDGITNNFNRYDPTKYVGVMQMTAYQFESARTSTYARGISAHVNVPYSPKPYPEAVRKSDNSMREFVVHTKYHNATVDGLPTSYSGGKTTGYLSHNTARTLMRSAGTQYSGTCMCDLSFVELMVNIIFGSLTLDNLMYGCCSMNYQKYAQVSEVGVNRVLLTPSDATNFEVDMTILIGSYTSSGTDRGTAANYDISGAAGAIITDIRTVTVNGTEYTALYVDINDFDTQANGSATEGTTIVSSFHWHTGITDNVLGNNGAYKNGSSQKYPYKVQGIECMVGCYEIVNDSIANVYADDDGNYWISCNTCSTAANQSTSITSNYEQLVDPSPHTNTGTSSAWQYIKRKSYQNGIMWPSELGGSSTTYTCDGMYQAVQSTTGAREILARGYLGTSSPAVCGVGALAVAGALSTASWAYGARLSANGNRGEWVG